MRKRLFPCVFLLAATLLCVALPSTSYPLSSAIPTEFTVSPDGTATVRVSVVSSVGYVRDCRIDTRDDGLYLTFYSTYGLNNPNGARDTFTISLPAECDRIFTYGGGHSYYPVYQKHTEAEEWQQV
ncbi:hypothetical protein H8S45_01880 [Agathobaculum sp. NSJ-28]|uniref:Uncharacterized protein n=2 Tax=Agathobaculum TaxID=2048137 RepID=A0A923LT85_9FIRM|nr:MULTISPECIES: hypothetical protein [Agathobaculum]MBC5724218.1 hypothetical protein [Agathobaculum faecis]MCU6787851.1 hypothetical protein [Agathobaculum ammoniilyticum]SCI47901.1 Uncharacterised protein [uncultured Butyricicoccus sp.]